MTTIGIDLGTYNSEVAYLRPDGKIDMLQAYHGGMTIPSFIEFDYNGEITKYGAPARDDFEANPNLVIWGLKRLFGRSYQSAKEEMDRFKYNMKENSDGSIAISIGNKRYTPVEITKMFLERIKKDCESPDINSIMAGKIITRAVISHPAYFDTQQIGTVRQIAQQVGFDSIELISEPEAAAIAYKDTIDFSKEPWVMVIDWGAGTLDIVIKRFFLRNGNPRIEIVSPPYGDPKFGGIDMDDILFKEAIRIYHLDDLTPIESNKIRSEIEKGKVELSNQKWTIRQAPYKIKSVDKAKPLKLKMARSDKDIPPNDKEGWIILENSINNILEKFKDHIHFSLSREGLTPDNIDQLILVGGPMFMPCVRRAIADIFKDNNKIQPRPDDLYKEDFILSVDPLEVVARGTAIYGGKGEVIGKDISIGNRQAQYEYGYAIRYEFVGDMQGVRKNLIPIRTPVSDVHIAKDKPIILRILSGNAIYISLLKGKETRDGMKYFKLGEYKFFPIVEDMLISKKLCAKSCHIQPILEMDKNLEVTIKIKDMFSTNEDIFTLKLSNHNDRDLINLPPDIDDIVRIQDETISDLRRMRKKKQKDDSKDDINNKSNGNDINYKGVAIVILALGALFFILTVNIMASILLIIILGICAYIILPRLSKKNRDICEETGDNDDDNDNDSDDIVSDPNREKYWITEDKVNSRRLEGEANIRFIEADMDSFKNYKDVMDHYNQLKTALKNMPDGPISKDRQKLYNDVGNAIEELRNILVNRDLIKERP